MSHVSRRTFLQASLAWAGLAVAGCAPVTGAPSSSPVPGSPAATPGVGSPVGVATVGPPINVKGAWVALTANQMLWPLAKDAGYFDKYGVNFDLSYINGSTTAVPAMTSGDIDQATIAGSTVVSAQAGGSDIIMVAGFVNQSIFRVLAAPSISGIADMRGKSIAVTKVGNADYFVWQAIAELQHWGPNDLNFVNAGDANGQIALLTQGQVQGISVSPPNNIPAEQAGAHEILDTATLNLPNQQVGMVVTRRYLAENRPAALAVLKASIEAIARWKKDPDFAKGVIKKYLQSDDQQFADTGYSAYVNAFPQVPYPSLDGFAEVIKEVGTQNDRALTLDPQQLMDTSLVKELDDSGFIRQIYAA